MIVVNRGTCPVEFASLHTAVGSPSGSSALAFTACCIAAPTSPSVTSMHAAGLGNAAFVVGHRDGCRHSRDWSWSGRRGRWRLAGWAVSSASPGVPHVAFRTIMALANRSTLFFRPASWMKAPSFTR